MTKTTSIIDADAVRQLANVLGDTGLTEIEYETQEFKIRIAKAPAVVQSVAVAAPATAAPVAVPAAAALPAAAAPAVAPENHPGAVLAPMVGVAYLSPEPGTPVFVQVGSTVSEGQTILLIEAMKTFNPVKASRSGKVTAILINDTTPVEYGQPLMIIE